MHFHSASRHVLQLTPKYLPVQPIFKALSLCSALNVTDQVSQQYKTTRKITILYIVIYFKREDKRFWIEWHQALPEFIQLSIPL